MRIPVPNSFGSPLREFNTNHEPAGTSVGGQFARSQSTAGATANRRDEEDNAHQLAKLGTLKPPSALNKNSPLLTQDIKSQQTNSEGGVSTSIFVTLADGSKAVYKPEVGEMWNKNIGWTNRDIPRAILGNPALSQSEREAMASEVDQALGLGIVPETVLREHVDVEVPGTPDEEAGGAGYDHDELNAMYQSWRNQEIDNGSAMGRVGDEMFQHYEDAKQEYANEVAMRQGQMDSLWNEVVDEHPEFAKTPEDEFGASIDKHPALPMGSADAFNVHKIGGKIADPMDLMDEAGVDPTSKFGVDEAQNIKAVMLKAMQDGYGNLGDFDDEKIGEKFEPYDEWIGQHADTEQNALDNVIKTYRAWKADQGLTSNAGDDLGGVVRNPNAPHPEGGSLQRFVKNGQTYGATSLDDAFKFAVLDYAIGSMDRHGHNVMYSLADTSYQQHGIADTKTWAIDNGLSFPNANDVQLRSEPVKTYLSMYKGKDAAESEPMRTKILRSMMTTDWQKFIARHPGMSREEKSAFTERLTKLTAALATDSGLYDLWNVTKQYNRMGY